MKRYLLFCAFFLVGFCVFADTVVGTISDEDNVVYCTMVGDSTPFVLVDVGQNGKTKELFILYGKDRMGPYTDVDDVIFSPSQDKIAYIAKAGREHYVFLGGEKIGPYDDVDYLTFSPDGQRMAYIAKIGRDHYVFLDSEKMGPYEGVENLVFSPNGKKIAYVIKMNKKQRYVVLGKEKLGPYNDVDRLVFSSNGDLLSFSAKIDKIKSNMVYSEGATYTGSIYKDRIIYMNGHNIMLK